MDAHRSRRPEPPGSSHDAELTSRERAEVARSAVEAAETDGTDLRLSEAELARYLDPPAETGFPLEYAFHLLGDVRGAMVLDYGCSDGLNAVSLARRGARICALDISHALLRVARRRLVANGVAGVSLVAGSAHALPLPAGSVDVVFGGAVLHHLELDRAAAELQRVLRPMGRAIFMEPVRNSRAMSALRRLIPTRAADVSPYERPLTDAELAVFGRGFTPGRSRAFRLPTTALLEAVPPLQRFGDASYGWDAALLRRLPRLARYATIRVLELIRR
jgi:2-polyprenyl-3-methyl-5-hydroxy-6-metoxy-1,4-benzoquinol methylase